MGLVAALVVVVMLTAGIYLFGYAARKSSLLYVLFLETIIGLILIFPLLIWLDGLSVKQIFLLSPVHALAYYKVLIIFRRVQTFFYFLMINLFSHLFIFMIKTPGTGRWPSLSLGFMVSIPFISMQLLPPPSRFIASSQPISFSS